jgi:hypothetical protein
MLEFQIVCIIVAFLYVWLDTDGVIEWAKTFHLKFFKYQEYNEFKKTPYPLKDYGNFLLMKYNNFFTRLITCPYCLAVWLNIIAIGFWGHLANIGVTTIGSWIGYALLKWSLFMLNK